MVYTSLYRYKSCCSRILLEMRIADHLAFVLVNLCRFMLIVTDQLAEVQPPHPSLPFRCFQPCGKYGGSGEYFPLIWFSVTVPVGSCLQGWSPLKGLPRIPPCLGQKCLGPCQHLRHKFPSSSIGDEFKDRRKCCTVMLSANVRNNFSGQILFSYLIICQFSRTFVHVNVRLFAYNVGIPSPHTLTTI